MRYDKLVRDRIPEIIESKGERPITRVASEEEYVSELGKKLGEEVAEFLKAPSAEEAADILEVLYALCDAHDIDRKILEPLREKKASERGAFAERLILEEVKE